MNLEAQWPAIARLLNSTFLSSLHYAVASVDENGDPHVSPIGSLIPREPGVGVFFPKFTRKLPENLKHNNKVCVLVVDSGRLLWVRSLIAGKFTRAPGIRLYGTVGPMRKATPDEMAQWQRRILPFKLTKGYRLLWSNMTMVREIHFTHARPLDLGRMTPG